MTKGYLRSTIGFLAVVILMLLASQSAFADDVYARIRGTVTDSTGAVVAGVQLTATNTLTGLTKTVTSQNTGLYEFVQLPVGTYTVTATKQGFRTYKSVGIALVVNQVYDLTVPLAVGSVSETVEVRANAVQVQTDNTQQGTLISTQQIVDLPLIGRNFTQLEQLAPGVMSASDRFNTFSVNGSQTQQSSYTINGTDTNDIPLNTPLILPSPDAIQEFNLISSTINPEYGRNSGGIVNAIIKNGTNQFHGNIFDFYRDTFLNTHNFFQTLTPVFHQNVFGGTFGGPIWKDKTFFFLSYQGTRARTAVGQNTSVYTLAQRNGDFSAAFNAIAGSSSATTRNDRNKVTPRSLVGDDGNTYAAGTRWICIPACAQQIFHPGTANFGKLPVSDFNSLSASLLNQFVPSPNLGANQFTFNPITNTVADQGIARIDHNLTSSDQLWGVVIINHSPSRTDLPFTGATLPGWGEVDSRETKNFTVAENHSFSTTTLNEVRLGYARFNFDAVEPEKPAQPSSFGFTGINSQNTVSASMPRVNVTGLFLLGFSTNGPQPRKDQNYQFTDNFSKVMGRHTMKFGFDARRFQVDNPFFGRNNGSFTFSTAAKFSTGSAGLDYLLGIPNTYSQGAGGVINARAYEYYGYAQDSWKLRSNLTLNYGVGYQVDTPYNSHQFGGVAQSCFILGQQSTVFPTAPIGMNYPGDPGCNESGGTSIHYGHFAPRFGFAYSPQWGGFLTGGPNKLSIRGGIGVYYNRTEEEGALQNLGTPPYGVNSAGIGDLGGAPSFATPFVDISTGASLTNKFPFTNFPKPGDATIDFTKFEPLGINTFNKNLNTPYAMNFNLNIQREFPSNTVVTLGYVGSLGRHLYRAYDANPITAAGQAACAGNAACSGNPALQHVLFPTHAVAGANTTQCTNINPLTGLPGGACFGGVGQQFTDGTSNYSALQANVTKGMTHGLQLLISYTWSHAIDNGSGLENSGFGTRGTNILVPSLNVGDSGNDARQRLVMGYIYTIPSLHHLAAWAPDRIFGGWKISGITSLQGGFPVNFSDNGFTSLSCDAFDFYGCADNPNQLGPVHTLNPRTGSFTVGGVTNTGYFFDPTLFAPAASGTFGNTRRNSLHGPGINNTDFALSKDTKVTERTTFEMGIEAYNLFNHTQFCTATSCVTTNIQTQGAGTFGRIFAAAPARLVQLRAKFNF